MQLLAAKDENDAFEHRIGTDRWEAGTLAPRDQRCWKLDTLSRTPQWEAVPPPLAVHGTNAAVLNGAIALAGGAARHGAYSVAGLTDVLQLYKLTTGR